MLRSPTAYARAAPCARARSGGTARRARSTPWWPRSPRAAARRDSRAREDARTSSRMARRMPEPLPIDDRPAAEAYAPGDPLPGPDPTSLRDQARDLRERATELASAAG